MNGDDSFIERELTEDGEEDWTMVDRLRNWRNDAMTQHLYGTAEFWGGKVFGMTGELFFKAGDTERMEAGRVRSKVTSRLVVDLVRSAGNPNDAFWLAQTHFLTHQYGQAEKILTILRLPHSSTTPVASPSTAALPPSHTTPRRLTDTSLACRYLAAQCQVRLGKWEEALEMVGRGDLLGELGGGGENQGDGGIKVSVARASNWQKALTTVL